MELISQLSQNPYTWIRTRDGSPTLWHNELGESFRSLKGAFSESWAAFVGPALAHAQHHPRDCIRIGEFGLGAGTNWALWTVAATSLDIAFTYSAIEQETASFELGFEEWIQQSNNLKKFFESNNVILKKSPAEILQTAIKPQVFSSLEEATEAQSKFDIWFHDPFGYEVNPDGYSESTLKQIAHLWAPQIWGASYACNRTFKDHLAKLSLNRIDVLPTGNPQLKRERLEFSRLEAEAE